MEQLKHDKADKAAEPDLMESELLKNIDEEVKKIVYNKIQDCYTTGYIPNYFTIKNLVTIPKKGNVTECGSYRTVSIT